MPSHRSERKVYCQTKVRKEAEFSDQFRRTRVVRRCIAGNPRYQLVTSAICRQATKPMSVPAKQPRTLQSALSRIEYLSVLCKSATKMIVIILRTPQEQYLIETIVSCNNLLRQCLGYCEPKKMRKEVNFRKLFLHHPDYPGGYLETQDSATA